MSEHAPSQDPPRAPDSVTNSNANRPILQARKNTSLWSYILPPTSSSPAPATPSAESSLPVPSTGPSDRNAVSVRLMLGDAKAALQQLSERVEGVVSEAADARREVAEAARGMEEAQAGAVRQVQVAANVAHTSRLEETSTRIAILEAALAAQNEKIVEVNRKCEFSQLQTADLLNRISGTYDAVVSLLPVIPLLQSLPTEIQNSQLKISSAIDHVGHESLRSTRDIRDECIRISEEQNRSTQAWISAELNTHFHAQTRLIDAWKDDFNSALVRLRSEFAQGLEGHRDSWTTSLSLHRQEMNGLFSARLSGSFNAACSANAQTTCSRSLAEEETSPKILPRTREKEDAGPDRVAGGTSATPHQVDRGLDVDIANTMRGSSETAPREPGLIRDEACGQASSTSGSNVVTAKAPQDTRPDAQLAQRSQHTVDVPNAGPSSHQGAMDKPARVLVEETQSTALSSVPSEDEDEAPDPEVDTIDVDAVDSEGDNGPARLKGRPFGALDQRTLSAAGDFTTPDSPPFSVHRKGLTVGRNDVLDSLPRTPIQRRVSRPHAPTWSKPRAPSSIIATSPWPGTAEVARAPTIGQSSARASPESSPLTGLTNINKRLHTTGNALHAPAKRQRRTRILLDSQELELDTSSPGR
ncbi:hypothetical protein BDV93DRAFT_605859 [Ceratobasidium sp. AG-I]|nr:hypothetical protein BDV93DRAFT_605859 [Ceratobasidium sp. AG-I]